jgi:hypothetical protein
MFICVLVSGASVYAQNNKKEDSMIEFGTKFTLKLSENDYSYSVIDKEPYTKTLGLTDIRSMFSQEDIKKDEIIGVLAYGKLGDDRQVFLILRNGLSTPLSYKLEIKQRNKTHFESTSVANLYPQVPSTEIWPYDIDYIVFSDFIPVKQ